MKPINDLTAEYLRSILDYDPNTGIFMWKERNDVRKEWNTRWSHKIAGSIHHTGYWTILINSRSYQAQRLAYLYMVGEWPEEVDHRDLDKLNNKWNNLRSATRHENIRNMNKRKNNKSGFKGVCFQKSNGKWRASVMTNRKIVYCRYFDTPEEASYFYNYAAQYHHGEFARVA